MIQAYCTRGISRKQGDCRTSQRTDPDSNPAGEDSTDRSDSTARFVWWGRLAFDSMCRDSSGKYTEKGYAEEPTHHNNVGCIESEHMQFVSC